VDKNQSIFVAKVVVLLAILGLCLGQAPVIWAQGNVAFQYFYDDIGRLVKVSDSAGNVVSYTYDRVGNILKISRSTVASATTLTIFNFTPAQGGVGTSVIIQGQGFNPTAALNSVSFNGTAATVVSATATAIVATVPAGASTGPITVTANGQTASSDTNFIFIPSPAVLSVSPKFAVTSPSTTLISNFVVTGAALNTATFAFQPVTVPPSVVITSTTADPTGTSATLSLSIAPNVAGSFTLVATNGSGSSSQVPSAANTLRIISPDGDDDNDGLTNAVEIALGTDPFNPSTAGDGITDGWKVFYGLDPFHPIATQDPDGDGFTNLQEFQAGTDPRNPDVTPPAVAQVFPGDQSTNFPTNGKIIVRFTEPLLNGINPALAQAAITTVASSIPAANQTVAAQVLQAYLQRTCCSTSIVTGIVGLTQGTTPVAGSVQLSNDSLSVTFTPAQRLLATTPYNLQVNNVRDLAGNTMTTAFKSTFTTAAADDITRPAVVATSPANGASGVPVNVAFTLQFTKRIDPSTLTPQSVRMQDNVSGLSATGTLQVDASGLTAAFVPSPNLSVGRSYSVFLDAGIIKDTSGNLLTGTTGFSFTTSFTPDNDVPHVLGTSPTDGATGVPTNGVVVLQFNEPLNTISTQNSIQLFAGATPVAGSIALSDSNRRITFTPAAPLAAATNYTVTIAPTIADLADRLIDNPNTFGFQTGAGASTLNPTVTAVNPLNGAAGTPLNTVIEVQFSQRVNQLTVTPSTMFLFPTSSGVPVGATVSVSPDGLSAVLTPNAPLVPETQYELFLSSGISNLAGQLLNTFASTFITGVATQTTAPQVIAVSPTAGANGSPVNAHVSVQISTQVNPITVTNSAITVTAAGVPVPGTITVSSDRRNIVFQPSALLAASTLYTVAVQGFTDVEGNPVIPFTSTFTTSASAVADKTAFQVLTVNPINGATAVPVTNSVVLTFNKPVDATTLNSNTVFLQGASLHLAGTLTANGAVVTFTPSAPMPGSTFFQVIVENPLQDAAGNIVNTFVSSFTTGAATDTTAPVVLSVTPNDGSLNIGLNATAVLTFSKPLNTATVNSNTFALFSGSTALGTSVSISQDAQTVTLSAGQLPPNRIITVTATSAVKDLAGNSLVDFNSRFTTAPAFDTAHASVTIQRPANGATGVPLTSSVVLYVNEALDPASAASAFHVSQNGVLAQGTVQVSGSGQILRFTPAAPWQNNALIQVFLETSALDVDGSPVNAYQGSFRTVVDTTTVAPSVVRVSPFNGAGSVPRNAAIELQFNEPLNPNSVNVNTVLLRENFCCNFALVAGAVSLDATGTIVRIVPNAPLTANNSYFFQTTTGIQGVNGLAQSFNNGFSFTTGAATDTAGPVVTLISPPDGANNVPVNADVHVRFNEPLNPLRVNAGTIQISGGGQTAVPTSLTFSPDNTEAVFTPLEPFPDNTLMTVTIAGVQDLAGNLVAPRTTQFTTNATAAAVAPAVISSNPVSGATNVALNSIIELLANSAVDPGTVNVNSFRLTDNFLGLNVPGAFSFSADGRTITFVPSAPLAVERSYSVIFTGGITDLAGNLLGCAGLCNYSFTTATVADAVAPAVLGVSPADQLTSVPINTQIVIQFNEPVNNLTLQQITVSSPGGPVSTAVSLANGQRTVILTPSIPLNASTQYTVSIAAVQDLSGNVLPAPVTTSFTTGPGADLLHPTVVASNPLNGSTGVPLNSVIQVRFSERVNPLTVTPSTMFLFPNSSGVAISASVSVSTDGLIATLTPSTPLVAETQYELFISSGVTNLAGLTLNTFATTFTTGITAQTTGLQVLAISPANGAAGIQVNAHVSVQLSSPVNPITVGSGAVTVAAGGVSVPGTLSISNDRRTITFQPTTLLSTSTAYTVTVSGFADIAGNPVTPFTSSFTTGASANADKTALQVLTVTPVNGATAVPVTTSVVLTFNKPVDVTSLNQNSVFLQAGSFHIPGAFALNGAVLTFAPSVPLPANTIFQVVVENPLQDAAGNLVNTFVSSFITGAAIDTTAPVVVSVTPNDGALNIGLNSTAVLTFSKPLNPATVNSNTFALFSGSTVLGTSVSLAADSQTVTLSAGQLPPGKIITVTATSGVKDLSGNSLVDFNSRFTTAAAFDTAHASVTNQRPGNGANGVPITSSVVLYINEGLDPATVNNAFHVSQNGILASGTVKLSGSGQILEFTPSAQWQNNALIQVFLDSTALDTDGSPVNAYQGSFRTAVDTTTVAPSIVRLSPFNGATGVPRNVAIDLQYNEPLDPATVNATTVLLRENFCCNFAQVPSSISLDATGTIVRIVPNAPLTANNSYLLQTTPSLRGANGLAQLSNQVFSFATGAVSDTVAPVITLVSPPDGSVGVPVNADVHVRFNEPVNPLRVSAATIQVSGGGQTAVAGSLTFSPDNTEIVLTPLEPFPDNTLMTVSIAGVQDLAGNPVVSQTTQFTTSALAATVVPAVISVNPPQNASNVAINTVIEIQLNAAVDPGTVTGTSFRLTDNVAGTNVPGTFSFNPDGRTITFLPNAPLAVERSYSVIFTGGITDLAGNLLGCAGICNYSFTTATVSDAVTPAVVAVSPSDHLTGVPINTQIVVQFNEPVNNLMLQQVTVSGPAGPISTAISLGNGQRTLILIPTIPLNAATQYSVNIAGVQDLSGNVLPSPVTTSFTTGPGADLLHPTVVVANPLNGATGIPVNIVPQVRFSERINPITVTTSTLFLFPTSSGVTISGTVSVSPDGLTAVFTPSTPLVTETQYELFASSGITNLAGLSLNTFASTFITGVIAQNTPPQITAVSPANAATGVPVNAHVTVLVSSPVNPVTVGNGAITVSAAGGPVTGSTTLSSDRRSITFQPTALLSASTAYTVTALGFSDVAGNQVTPFTSSFTTGATATADKTALTVQTVSPANGATGVPVASSIVLTFNKPVDATTVNTNTVFLQGAGIRVQASYTVSGAVVSFTPSAPLPGNTFFQVVAQNPLQDAAGNLVNTFVSSFTTGPAVDTTAPAVVSITPNDGALNIGLNATAVLTFSKPLNPSTVNANTFALFAGSTLLGTSVSLSSDAQTVTLSSGQLPASRQITVAATPGVKDLAGNALPDFTSRFTTATAFDTAHAAVTNQRPGNGATGVPVTSSVVIYINEALDPATAASSLHVSQNGILAQGTVKLSAGGQILEFTPSTPWLNNALIQVFLDSTALDTDGSPVTAYQGSFHTAADTTTTAPTVQRISPFNGATGIPQNTVVELQYNEPLNPTSVNSTTVLLRENFCCNFAQVPGTITLDTTGTVIRIVPNAPLVASSNYFIQTSTGILGANGVAQSFALGFSFTTNTTSDTVAPVVTLVSPPDGVTAVPVNADVHVRFSEPINPIHVNTGTIQITGGGQTAVASSITLSPDNTEAVLTPLEPFPDNTLMTIAITGVQDVAGNAVVTRSTQFTTSATAVTVAPAVISANPPSGATNVPTNVVVALQLNSAVDPGSVNINTFRVFDNAVGQNLPGVYSFSADGKSVLFVPNAILGAQRSYSVIFTGGMTDLAGNVLGCAVLCNYSFNTGTATDAVSPSVLGVSPADQVTGAPVNTQVMVLFNEPINSLSLQQVVLSNAGGPVTTVASLTNGQRALVLTPVVPLNTATQYTVTVAGVQDLAGNVLPTSITTSFTTGTGADLLHASVVAVNPANGATGTPINTLIQVQFNDRVNPLTVTPTSLEVFAPGGILLSGTTSVSSDGLLATFTPAVPLVISTQYQISVTGTITNLVGLSVNGFNSTFTTGAGTISTIAGGGAPPSGVSATAGQIGRPRGLIADAAGNYYISSAVQTRVFKVDASGTLTIFAGSGISEAIGNGGAATAAGLFMRGLAVDTTGNLFIADPQNLNVRRVDAVTGIITTVAGGGTATGDGGSATQAALLAANSVVIDRNGNLFIAEPAGHRVRRVDAGTGIISTFAGNGTAGFSGDGGPATSAQLTNPADVKFDAAGNLYISDLNNNRVRRVDVSTGKISTFAGNGTSATSGDGGPATSAGVRPIGLALDAAGNLFIGDSLNLQVRRVDAATGVITTYAGNGVFDSTGDGGPAASAALKTPEFITVDSSGALLIAEASGDRIRRVDPATRIITTVAGNGQTFTGDGQAATSGILNFPQDVRLDKNGNILIADANMDRVRRVSSSTGVITTIAGNGLFSFSGDNGPATSAGLNNPVSVITDALGNIFISDLANNRIRRVDAVTGVITTFAGTGTAASTGDGGQASAAALNSPIMAVFDGSGSLFIAESARIRRVDGLTGIITTVAGTGVAGFSGDGGPAISAQVNFSAGGSMTIDANGNLFTAEGGNNRIRRVDAVTGIITTVAGNGTAGFSGDGGGATSAALSTPVAVAVDAFGNLFIADALNNRTRRVDAATRVISTIVGNGTLGFAGDGGSATQAQLAEPAGVAIDATGALLIVDFLNNRIRRVPGSTRPATPGTFRGPSAPVATLLQNGSVTRWASITSFPNPLQGDSGGHNTQGFLAHVAGISLNSKTLAFWTSNPCLSQPTGSRIVSHRKCELTSLLFTSRPSILESETDSGQPGLGMASVPQTSSMFIASEFR